MLGNLFDSGEHRLVQQCAEIITVAKAANRKLRSQLKANRVNVGVLSALEKKADSMVFNLAFLITSGAVAPNVIDDFLTMVRKEDSIVDSLFNLSREINRYSMNAKLRARVNSKLDQLLALSDLAILELEQMLKEDRIEEISRHRIEIERYEELGDDIKDGLIEYAYATRLNFKEFYHVIELGLKADDILDSAQGVSDYFTNIMLSLTT